MQVSKAFSSSSAWDLNLASHREYGTGVPEKHNSTRF